jgi:hypothetical protein
MIKDFYADAQINVYVDFVYAIEVSVVTPL